MKRQPSNRNDVKQWYFCPAGPTTSTPRPLQSNDGNIFWSSLSTHRLGSNPRGRLAELRAWRRKRAFSRKFETGARETPSHAIVLAAEEEVLAQATRLRCECGATGSAEAHPPRTEELVLGEQRLVVAKWTCARCGRARHAYFTHASARAA
ncbi:hypothetical protein [Archangium violaceum]|uniref:hypothetical protein n=1 Tax=Archangium violaceum TaxID=83451 RepID=UPI0036D8936B